MRFALLIGLVACGGGTVDPVDSDAITAGDDDTTEPVNTHAPSYSGGQCPALSAGSNTGFASGNDDREFRLDLPDDPQGAPVVFVWHWLGGNADEIIDFSRIAEFPGDHGVIVVGPETRGLPYEWDTYAGKSSPDLVFFDDILSCLYDQYTVDLDRIYTTGMSAGGLWTATLVNHRSKYIAAAAMMSGGVTEATWTAKKDTAMMLIWGGPNDTYGTFNFQDSTLDLSSQLQDMGHFVVHCDHGAGHLLPPGGSGFIWDFFVDHPLGIDPSPWASGLPNSAPDFCALP